MSAESLSTARQRCWRSSRKDEPSANCSIARFWLARASALSRSILRLASFHSVTRRAIASQDSTRACSNRGTPNYASGLEVPNDRPVDEVHRPERRVDAKGQGTSVPPDLSRLELLRT